MYSWEGYGNTDLDSTIYLITTKFEALGENKEKLIHELDKLFTHGQMSDGTKTFYAMYLMSLIRMWAYH